MTGTMRDETLSTRGAFVDLLVIAGSSLYGDNGEIKACRDIGLTDEQLASALGTDVQSWNLIRKRLVATKRIEMLPKNIIRISNWSKYQSEYERQKAYRELQPKVTTESYDTQSDKEKEKEKEKENTTEKETKAKKEPKKHYGEFQNVLLTDAEYHKLETQFGDQLMEKIVALSGGKESKGYHYKSDYAAILNWDRRDKKDAKGKQRGFPDPGGYTPTPDYGK